MSKNIDAVIEEIIKIEKRYTHGKKGTTVRDRRIQVEKCLNKYLEKNKS